ncbi:MAG: YHS domain-containing (seleno)protein [Pseudomonadota bacterium]
MTRSIRMTLMAASLATMAGSALAGPQYVDGTGFAVSGYDVVAYHDLKQNPVGSEQPKAVPGKADITADYNGAKWAFSSAANRDKFLADPARYAPEYDGHCAYGISRGGKVPANPHLWRIRDGKLYLNITNTVVGFWEEDISGNLSLAEKKWGKLESKKAATRAIPEFDKSSAPAK